MAGYMAGGGGYEAFYPSSPPEGVDPFIWGEGDISIPYESSIEGAVTAAAPAFSPEYFPDGFKGLSVQRYFFYDTIQVTPSKFQLGVIASDQILRVVVWNGNLSGVTVTDLSSNDGEGITNRFLEYPSVIGTDLPPLGEVTWEFSVSKTEGPATFDAFEFLWVDGRPYWVEISGTRAQLWAFTHNWSESLVETLDWLSAVNVTYAGDEHRASLRGAPRLTIDSTLYLSRDSSRKVDHLLFAKQTDFFTAPLLQFMGKLTSAASPGDNTLYLDTTNRGYVKGGSVILLDGLNSTATSVAITEVNSDHLVLASGIQKGWPAGAEAYPAAAARLIGDVPLKWDTHEFATGKARLEFQPGFTDAFTPTDLYPVTATYDSGVGSRGAEEILLQEPDWANGMPKGFSYQAGVIDSPTGTVSIYQTRERPERTIPYEWLLKDRQAVGKFRAFLQRRLGRTVPFWCSTWTADLRAVAGYHFSSGSHEFRFYDHGFIAFSLQNYASARAFERTNIQIQLRDGRCFRGRIESAERVDDSVSRVIFDRGYEFTFYAEDILRVSFLNLYRLTSDSVSLEWLTPGVAKVALGFVTVSDNISYLGE